MTHWTWWWGGLALAAVPVLHWLLLDRTLAVSGRFNALVDRARRRRQPEPDMTRAQLLEALRAQTVAAFGEHALEPVSPEAEETHRVSDGVLQHALFLGGLTAGGLLSLLLAGGPSVTPGLRSQSFAMVAAQLGVPGPVLLLLGGMLVGFGTRMAAGCTSGHGLCGVSQLEAGSLLATGAFFGAGVATSFLLSAATGVP